MKKSALFPGFILILATFILFSGKKEQNNNYDWDKTKIILKLPEDYINHEYYIHDIDEIPNPELKDVFADYEIKSFQSIFSNRYNEHDLLKEEYKNTNKHLLRGWFEIEAKNFYYLHNLVSTLKKFDEILHAFIEEPIKLEPALIPNDPDYPLQWHLNNPGNPNFDIDAEDAWDINIGRNDVVVAILDGGVDYNHPDLDPGNRSRVIQGWDAGDNDNDPLDDAPGGGFAGHGTLVAGVVGAITSNNSQVSGVMWNCSIMPVKIVSNARISIFPHPINITWDFANVAFPGDVAEGIDFAVNNGADIINLSYSFPNGGLLLNDIIYRVPLLYDAISNAYQNNVVITASMGNSFEDNNNTRYPAGFREVIAVGATNQNGDKRNTSNTGPHIDLSAPGTGIWTTERGGGSDNPSGTSFSAPIVAGVAGLVISQGRDRGFELTNDDVKRIMEITATETGPETGFDEETGHGIVNAHHALQLLQAPNELYHYSSTGGNYSLFRNYGQWVYIGANYDLAPGTYYNVDQYRVTKHIEFPIPFCDIPTLWMRERGSEVMSFSSANDGYPWVNISNVTTTGFDIEYAVHFIRTDLLGRTINKWIPAHPNQTRLNYTVVGEPNPAAAAGPISGPSLVCTSNRTFTVQDVPQGVNVTWSVSPADRFAVDTGTGNSFATRATSSSTSGQGTITATLQGPCGNIELTKDVWMGKPDWEDISVYEESGQPICPNSTARIHASLPSSQGSILGYEWGFLVSNGVTIQSGKYSNPVTVETPGTSFDYFVMKVKVENACGWSGFKEDAYPIYEDYGCGMYSFSLYPNPASTHLTVLLDENNNELITSNLSSRYNITNSDEEFNLDLYNNDQEIVLSSTSTNKKIVIETEVLPKGIYFLHLNYKNKIQRKQIIIE